MAPFRHRPVRNLLPIPFEQTGAPEPNPVGINTPDDTQGNKNARNNASAAQYPYPSPSPSINGEQDTPSTTPSRNQANSIPVDAQGGNGGPQTVVQAPQQTSESATVFTSSVSTSTTTSVPAVSSSSTASSSVSSRSTTAGSTLSVPPPNFSTRLTTIPPSLSFRSQTFSDTDSSLISTSQSTADDTTSTSPPPIQLSPTAIGILIAIGGTILLVAFVCILRCTLRYFRHKRRRMKESAFDFVGSKEKNPWETGDGEKSGGMGAGRSPSTIFGGNERLTPQPSWTTFHEGDRGGTASPYPLGLLPPPTNVQRAPSLRAHAGLGISHQTFHNGYSNYNHSAIARQTDPRNQSFGPPTITITNSSPRQSAPWIAKQSHDRNGAGGGAPKDPSSGSGISPANSYNRVSVYTDPVNGAQLVKPPRLTLVNDDPSLSESDGGPRQSGWSSWDDSVGLELGVTIDRKHLPPRRRSRIPVSKGKKGVSPLRITLASVQEVSDTSDPEAIKKFPARSPATPTSKLHPQGPYVSQGQLRRGPSSPIPLRPSPRSAKSASPRALKQPQPQTLYDLPQFEVLSPSGNSSIQVASPNSVPNSPLREPESESSRGTGTGSSKRRSKRSSRRTSSNHPPVATAAGRRSSVVSEALSDMYAYVHAYALSSTESEEMQVRRRSKPKSPRSKDAPYGSPLAVGSLPAVSHTVGALMMKAYGEEGSIPSPSIPQLRERGKGKKRRGSGRMDGMREMSMKESNRVNVLQASHSVGLGLTVHKQQQQSRIPHSARQRRSDASAGNRASFSPQSEYSEHPNQQPSPTRYPDSSRSLALPQQRGVPSLPPPGMPNLHQLKLMRDMPDYRSPTYSVYGMYRDENGASPLQNSPVQYRYASPSTTSGKTGTGNGKGGWRADVI